MQPTIETTLQGIFSHIEGMTPTMLQTADQCSDYITTLLGWMAYANEKMAVTGKAYNIAKRDAYTALQKRFDDGGKVLSPMLAKDYINSMCSKEAYMYDLANRCSALLVHTVDAMRSILSTKKEEMALQRFAQI